MMTHSLRLIAGSLLNNFLGDIMSQLTETEKEMAKKYYPLPELAEKARIPDIKPWQLIIGKKLICLDPQCFNQK